MKNWIFITWSVGYKLGLSANIARRHRLNYLLYWQLDEICPEKIPDMKLQLQEDFRKCPP